jgi:hypothetical protein
VPSFRVPPLAARRSAGALDCRPNVLHRIRAWWKRIRESHAVHIVAWSEADTVGADGYTNFERNAITSLEPITGKLTLVRGTGNLLLWTGPIPGTPLVLYLYGDEAQVWGPKVSYRKEQWDFDTPAESVESLVTFVRACLQSNKSLERSRER